MGESDSGAELKNNVFAVDEATIDLCLAAFHRTSFRSIRSGIKLYAQLNLKTVIPALILFSNASLHGANVLEAISFEADSFYVPHKGCVDCGRLYRIRLASAFFL